MTHPTVKEAVAALQSDLERRGMHAEVAVEYAQHYASRFLLDGDGNLHIAMPGGHLVAATAEHDPISDLGRCAFGMAPARDKTGRVPLSEEEKERYRAAHPGMYSL